MHRSLRRLAGIALIALAATAVANAQDDPTLYVVSYVEAVPASRGQVAAMLRQLADASRREGALRFEVLQGTTQSNQFLILETWKNQQALDAHVSAAQTTRFRDAVAPLLAAPVDVRLCVATTVAPSGEGRDGLHVVTHVDVGPGDRQSALQFINAFAEQSRRDAGNLRFDVVHQKARTNHLTLIEIWTDDKSDDAHQLAAHTKKFRADIGPFLGALYDQRWYRTLAAP